MGGGDTYPFSLNFENFLNLKLGYIWGNFPPLGGTKHLEHFGTPP